MNEIFIGIGIAICCAGCLILGIVSLLYNRRSASTDREYRESVEDSKREIGECTEELNECNRTITEARKTLRELTAEIRQNQKVPSDNK